MNNQPTLDFEPQLPDNPAQVNFERYIADNADIWKEFVKFTLQAIKIGHKHLGVDMVLGQIRWHSPAQGDDGFKCNNTYKPWLARKFHAEYPQHDGFFRTRKAKADSE